MTVSNDTTIMVGLGDVKISDDPESVLACLGLGSCVAVSVFDPVAKIWGMAHVVLPASQERPEQNQPVMRISPFHSCSRNYENAAARIPAL